MLKLEDLACHSDAELADIVRERCSAFGSITRITIYRARQGGAARPFAIVGMTAREAAERLSTALEGRTVGNAVIIFLDRPARSEVPVVAEVLSAAPEKVLGLS